jgi:hypothetical protein
MAIEHIVAGPVIVTFQSQQLGYTRDGAKIRVEPKYGDVKSDDYGGEGGAPSDSQMLGAEAFVTCELTKYEAAQCNKLTAFGQTLAAATAGALAAFGTLMRQGSKTGTLLLDGVNEDWTFSVAFCHEAIEVNKGTKFTTFMCGFRCWVNAASTRVLLAIS